jgi:hypothetical protein
MIPRVRRAFLVATLGAVAGAGCSLFTDLDALRAGAVPDASVADAPIDRAIDAPPQCGADAAVPGNAVSSLSITMSSIDLGEGSPPSTTYWQGLGFNIDGKCTTATSTDVCALASDASAENQVDGVEGRDNAWGKVLLPLLFASTPNATPSATASSAASYLVLVAGSGTLSFKLGAFGYISIPIRSGRVLLIPNGKSILSGVIDTEAFIVEVKKLVAAVDSSLCSGATFDNFARQVRGTSDIFVDGGNDPGLLCNGISIGVTFGGYAVGDAGPPVVTGNPCPDGG